MLLLAGSLWAVWPFLRTGGDIGAGPGSQPSRLWGAPETVPYGQPVALDELIRHLEDLGYREVVASKEAERDPTPLPVRRFERRDEQLRLHLPDRVGPGGAYERALVVAHLSGDEATFSTGAGGAAGESTSDDSTDSRESLYLGAPLLGSYYGDGAKEILPIDVDELPPHVTAAVLAAEDRRFYYHLGLSPLGIARALWVNLQEGEVRQGGSTITQQLVKNVFLTHERSLPRKLREAVLSLVVEVAYSKERILQAYLNQIYLGTGHRLNIHGFGAAARHFYDVDARDLSIGQAATLAGMIRAPAYHSPLDDRVDAKTRRDQVLAALLDTGAIDERQHAAAKAEPIEAVGVDLGVRFAPYFADAVAREARERFGVRTLAGRGYQIFSTLSRRDQMEAERAVSETLRRLPARDRLEAALLSVDPQTGAVLAWVGGRNYEDSQFDRVHQAERQAGSAFKPVVLAAALLDGRFTPSTRLDDSPLALDVGGRTWEPTNSDGRFRGPVTLRRTIEDSLNVPTVRLAQDVGLGSIRSMARGLGIESRLEEIPSMSLGAFEVTPLELTTVYATLAAGGQRPTIHGIATLTDARGERVGSDDDLERDTVLDPAVAAQVTSILQGTVARGTGRAAARVGAGSSGPVAGKTGTSNEARDNWFAAYRIDRATVVWVGHDKPQPTPLSGARAALPIWAAYAGRAYPEAPDPSQLQADGLESVRVCRDSGLLPVPACPTVVDEVFRPQQAPDTTCDLHTGRGRETRPDKPGNWLGRKLKKIFG